jgi:predicted Rossmann fold nucleotide-binding protein DprA/Smf involved in DNA uptake
MTAFDELKSNLASQGITARNSFETIRLDILRLVEQNREDRDSRIAMQATEIKDLQAKLAELRNEESVRKEQARVLKSLYFKDIDKRLEQIVEAERNTNAWLFDSSLSNFPEWLESEDSLYCVVGKVIMAKTARFDKSQLNMDTGW